MGMGRWGRRGGGMKLKHRVSGTMMSEEDSALCARDDRDLEQQISFLEQDVKPENKCFYCGKHRLRVSSGQPL